MVLAATAPVRYTFFFCSARMNNRPTFTTPHGTFSLPPVVTAAITKWQRQRSGDLCPLMKTYLQMAVARAVQLENNYTNRPNEAASLMKTYNQYVAAAMALAHAQRSGAHRNTRRFPKNLKPRTTIALPGSLNTPKKNRRRTNRTNRRRVKNGRRTPSPTNSRSRRSVSSN